MKNSALFVLFALVVSGCGSKSSPEASRNFTGAPGEVKLITVDPGHFHAALVQKFPLEQIDPVVKVYGPEGPDLEGHIARIEGFNQRDENPTRWQLDVYRGDDFFERMLAEKAGNLMVVAGNNAKKTDYIVKAIEAGLNVLADKPMVISPDSYALLEEAFRLAESKGVLLYDIMTERYEITTALQRELSLIESVFGQLQSGSPDEPAITKESVHHFSKMVSGSPLIRPAWFFDVDQQGEGIVDVTTHLVDLIQWEAFPNQTLSKSDVELVSAKRWTTDLTLGMFQKVTGLNEFPDYLQKDIENGILKVYSNGEINYKLRGIHSKVSVIWDFEAPPGTGDTHYSIMRGTKSNIIIKQGAEENFQPTLYIEPSSDQEPEAFAGLLASAVKNELSAAYPGVELVRLSDNQWTITIPQSYKVGHEAHFTKVAEKYLGFLVSGAMPEWEVPNILVKYYTLTEALRMAKGE